MINSEDFSERLKKVMEFYGLSASALSDKIGVQRSSISHILSGRNKPSLDFVMKVLEHFDEVDLYWLLNGKGDFPVKQKTAFKQDLSKTAYPLPDPKKKPSNSIERIVIFFKDGSFKDYFYSK